MQKKPTLSNSLNDSDPSFQGPWGDSQQAYWGVIHVHSDFSDGNISVTEIVRQAQNAGLDFLIITDHNNQGAKLYEGYHDDLLIAVEVEVTPSNIRNHLIAIGLDNYTEDSHIHALSPGDCLEEIQNQGALSWVPHPHGFSNLWFAPIFNLPWRQWDHRVDGIELGTFTVDWFEGMRPWNIHKNFSSCQRTNLRIRPKVLKLWDKLNEQRPVAGFIGIDAHCTNFAWLQSPSYEEMFQTHNLQLFMQRRTMDAQTDLALLRAALREQQFVNAMGHVRERSPLRLQGSKEGLVLDIDQRQELEVRWICNGQELPEYHGELSLSNLAEGSYRAEIDHKGELWALTNPIRIRNCVEMHANSQLGATVSS